jgi:DNA-binding MarR family transcriptional regulator
MAALDHAHSPTGTDDSAESLREATRRALQAALDDPQLSQSLLRGLALLSCYSPQREWRTISELAKELDLPPSTAHRYARTLRAIGLLEQHPGTREYRPAATA